MSDPAKALATQLANIEKRTGKTLAELGGILRASGLTKHGELREYAKCELGMGAGDANTLVHHVLAAGSPNAGAGSPEAALDAIYTGAKAALRPIHDKVMEDVSRFGEFEIAPKKTYLSLRRKKQFAMIGPATNTRVEVGLNLKGVDGTGRLVAMPPGGMCSHVVKLTSVNDANAELTAWIRAAYDAAG
jgi:hypothetical protein